MKSIIVVWFNFFSNLNTANKKGAGMSRAFCFYL